MTHNSTIILNSWVFFPIFAAEPSNKNLGAVLRRANRRAFRARLRPPGAARYWDTMEVSKDQTFRGEIANEPLMWVEQWLFGWWFEVVFLVFSICWE